MDRLHGEGREVRGREIGQVEGDHGCGVGAHRSSEDVPILRVVGHGIDQRFVADDLRVPEVLAHLRDDAGSLVWWRVVREVPLELGQDVERPQWAVGLRDRKTQQGVAQVVREQHARVENDRERHAYRRSRVEVTSSR